ncbi:TPA: hypothetical protein ACPZNB_004502, partial [Yersinia enterocolitica]
ALCSVSFTSSKWYKETVCHPVDVDAVSHAYSTVALRILVAIANGGSVSEISKNVPEWHFTH